MTRSSKGIRRWAVVGALVVGVGTSVAAAAPAATAAPYCGIYWGSLPKTAKITETAPMVNVRAGQHACFDRMVVDVRAGGADGYFVKYVDTVRQDGSGFAVSLRGGARLQVTVVAPAYDDNYRQTYRPANRSELDNVAGWQTFRQIAWAGSFEGQSTIGLGVRARLPFRVFVLQGPGAGSRFVVDVAHRWQESLEAVT
jgi:hypothetical protein